MPPGPLAAQDDNQDLLGRLPVVIGAERTGQGQGGDQEDGQQRQHEGQADADPAGNSDGSRRTGQAKDRVTMRLGEPMPCPRSRCGHLGARAASR